jgi:UDP-N-acetylglucosamine 2-epimerase
VRYVKCDTQGWEAHVLAGARDLLARRDIIWEMEICPPLLDSAGSNLDDVCATLAELAARPNGTGVSVVYPVHPNPNVRASVARHLEGKPHVHLLPPVSYHQFVHLMKRAHFILTDSGGIQEEAPGLSKPVLVLRERTERPEAVAAGTARIVGTDPARIRAAVDELLTDPAAYAKMATAVNPFGDGHAAERIAHALENA